MRNEPGKRLSATLEAKSAADKANYNKTTLQIVVGAKNGIRYNVTDSASPSCREDR